MCVLFLGFKRKDNGKLDAQAQGFGVGSDWPELNDLCRRTGTELKCTAQGLETVNVSDVVVKDPSNTAPDKKSHLLQP